MSEIPKISEAEWEVMKIVWLKSSPCTANEIVDALTGVADWKPNTIKTLINRLVKKKALGYKEEGRQYRYYPLVDQAECIKSETNSFVKRMFGGTLQPMLVAFLKEEKLSQDEIEELKRIIEERKG
ncbi:BlaI/MecI/CopY family transcriptional regulator [Desulfosporosinus youngiae]|uniref:Putative transcriptional regulator n=1 Tax=Desulfosporosinus youngiae DSM 17734 TaxID=768710 RepID=H5XV29_9FIRM|nr:BlaI/MecI/CopY family transcriptional regulator [Desulfosporosinus youngiae]EHQ89481.1 putative transcriptional regulator [Desulfosporosinus youngiae DSM 17734]